MSYDPHFPREEKLIRQEDLDALPQEYLEAEYPHEYRARRDWSFGWRDYGPWY